MEIDKTYMQKGYSNFNEKW